MTMQRRLEPDERFLAFLDDIYAVDERAVFTAIQGFRTHTGIEVH